MTSSDITLEEWKKHTTAFHQNFNDRLGDRVWDLFDLTTKTGKDHLFNKIAFALYGEPKDENGNINDVEDGYSQEQRKKVSEMVEKIIRHQSKDEVILAVFFMSGYKSGTCEEFAVPVIRLKKGDGKDTRKSCFIDFIGRVYNDWDDLMKNNVFPGWWIALPEYGKYLSEKEVCLTFQDQTEIGKVLDVADKVAMTTSITTGVTSVAGAVMCFFVPTAPFGAALLTYSAIVGTPAAVYDTGRSIGTLVDRGNHDQSISLVDAEARACWLTTVTSVLSVATLGSAKALSSAAKAGRVASYSTRVACTALNVTTVSLNGAAIINGIVEVAKKGKEDKVTPLDILQLTTSIFFFTHSVVNFKTASTIIKDAQKEIIAAKRAQLGSENERRVYDAFHDAEQKRIVPGKTEEMHGQAEFIRKIVHLEDKSSFFKHFEIASEGGPLSVNRELTIDTKAFLQMKPEQKTNLLDWTRQLREKHLSETEFHKKVAPIKQEYRLTFERSRNVASEKMNKRFNGDIKNFKINGKRIFENMKPRDIDRMDNVMRNAGRNYDEVTIKVGTEMAERMKATNVSEYTASFEYANRQIDNEVSVRMKQNSNPKRGPGIKVKDYYRAQVQEEFLNNTNNFRDQTVMNFKELVSSCESANTKGQPQFGNKYTAANHYDKHKDFPKIRTGEGISIEDYFAMGRDLVKGFDKLTDYKWAQDGESISLTFKCPKRGAMAIKYQIIGSDGENQSLIATLMKDNVPLDVAYLNPNW